MLSSVKVILRVSYRLGPTMDKVQLRMDQILPGGIMWLSENRVIDWKENGHSDLVFGELISQTQFVGGTFDIDGSRKMSLNLDMQSILPRESDAVMVKKYLEESVSAVESFCIQDFIRNTLDGWTAEQVLVHTRSTLIAGGS